MAREVVCKRLIGSTLLAVVAISPGHVNFAGYTQRVARHGAIKREVRAFVLTGIRQEWPRRAHREPTFPYVPGP